MTQKQPGLAASLLRDGVQKLAHYKQYVSAADLFTILVNLHASENHALVDVAGLPPFFFFSFFFSLFLIKKMGWVGYGKGGVTELARCFEGDAAVLKPLLAALVWAKAGGQQTLGDMQTWQALSADANWRAGDYAAAYDHFRQSGLDAMPAFADMLVEWHSHDGHPSETAIFITRPLLQFVVGVPFSLSRSLF
jgi:hypothetical protein